MFRRSHRIAFWPASLGLVAVLAGCAPGAADRPSPFSASGEVIAMGGGGAGPQGACFTCHGLQGEGDGAYSPRLAGLPAGYLQKQLQDYATGLRDNAVMGPIAKALSAPARASVADYYAQMPQAAEASGGAPDPVALHLYHERRGGGPSCADCHGAGGEGNGLANPPIAGQPEPYLAKQLKGWDKGERRNDPLGVMARAVRPFSPAERQALAGYVAALPTTPAPIGGPRAASP
jgi:cytochrome c553